MCRRLQTGCTGMFIDHVASIKGKQTGSSLTVINQQLPFHRRIIFYPNHWTTLNSKSRIALSKCKFNTSLTELMCPGTSPPVASTGISSYLLKLIPTPTSPNNSLANEHQLLLITTSCPKHWTLTSTKYKVCLLTQLLWPACSSLTKRQTTTANYLRSVMRRK